MDPLSDVITLLRPHAALSKPIMGRGEWGVRYAAYGLPGFAIVLEGQCWLAIEAAELMEHFQWLTPEEAAAVSSDAARQAAVGEELADVVCYALALANELSIDLSEALAAKMLKNAQKYPVEKSRGRWGEPEA